MTNRVTLLGKLVDAPKIRTIETRGGTIEIVSLWIEVHGEARSDRFTVEITDPKAAAAAKAMRAEVLAEITGQLRHDRWKDKTTGRWTGKVYVAVEPGHGNIRSKGLAAAEPEPQAA